MLFLNQMYDVRKISSNLFFKTGLLLIILSMASCKPDKIKVYSNFYQYYPLKVGSYLIYNADSIKYYKSLITVKKPDTIVYQIMDSIQSRFVDATGQTVYRIQESRRKTIADQWIIFRVFTRSINSLNAQEVDGNLRFIKMIFPVSLYRMWNPDLYNTTDSAHLENADFVKVHQPFSSQNLTYDSTVLVQIRADSTLISKNIYNERYASEIGLIRMEHDSVYYLTSGVQGGDTSIAGFRYKQTLSDYGPR